MEEIDIYELEREIFPAGSFTIEQEENILRQINENTRPLSFVDREVLKESKIRILKDCDQVNKYNYWHEIYDCGDNTYLVATNRTTITRWGKTAMPNSERISWSNFITISQVGEFIKDFEREKIESITKKNHHEFSKFFYYKYLKWSYIKNEDPAFIKRLLSGKTTYKVSKELKLFLKNL